jgi:hypothetical protein
LDAGGKHEFKGWNLPHRFVRPHPRGPETPKIDWSISTLNFLFRQTDRFAPATDTNWRERILAFFCSRSGVWPDPYRARFFLGVLTGIVSGLTAPLMIGSILFVYGAAFPVPDAAEASSP